MGYDLADFDYRLHFGCGEKKGLLKERGCGGAASSPAYSRPPSRFCMQPTT